MTDKTFKDYLKEDNITEAVDQPLIDAVVDQIIRDLDMGDQTAIEELLKSCPEAKLRGFLSEVGESVTEAPMDMEDDLDELEAEFLASLDHLVIFPFVNLPDDLPCPEYSIAKKPNLFLIAYFKNALGFFPLRSDIKP